MKVNNHSFVFSLTSSPIKHERQEMQQTYLLIVVWSVLSCSNKLTKYFKTRQPRRCCKYSTTAAVLLLLDSWIWRHDARPDALTLTHARRVATFSEFENQSEIFCGDHTYVIDIFVVEKTCIYRRDYTSESWCTKISLSQ